MDRPDFYDLFDHFRIGAFQINDRDPTFELQE